VAAPATAGVAAITPPTMSAIGVMIASERRLIRQPPSWLARKTFPLIKVSTALLLVTDSAHD
jgi:hypothetical protein